MTVEVLLYFISTEHLCPVSGLSNQTTDVLGKQEFPILNNFCPTLEEKSRADRC